MTFSALAWSFGGLLIAGVIGWAWISRVPEDEPDLVARYRNAWNTPNDQIRMVKR